MAEAAVSLAMEKLDDLLTNKKFYLRDNVEGQLKGLKDELETMQSLLKVAIERQDNDERIRNWISQLREEAQNVENAVETFIYKVETPLSRRLLGIIASYPSYALHATLFRKDVESIKRRINQIICQGNRFKLQPEVTESAPTRSEDGGQQHELAAWCKDKDVVGLDKDVKQLLEKAILEESEGLSIAGIIGMGGLGKSTLARKLYNNVNVIEQFECRAWVCISSEFRLEEVMKELILQVLDLAEDKQKVLENMKQMDEASLQQMLFQRLQGRRYFVVLDDVWEFAHFKFLTTVFPKEDKASRLLVTSRSAVIGSLAGYKHLMRPLDPEESWQLLLKKAFVDDGTNCICQDLENIGRKILERCLGLPLAITMIGSLLKKQSKSGWAKVLKELNSALENHRRGLLAILEMCYRNMSPKLKSCFLCLGFFKEDATIQAQKLVQVWIAEGLVPQDRKGEMTEGVATSYLKDLINLNMIQVKDMSKDGRVKNCHIHGLVRDFAIMKANEEINFEILREEAYGESLHKPRHLAMYSSRGKSLPSTINQNKYLRSLFVHGSGRLNDANSPSYWKSFELLRVLDFEDCGLLKLPETIGGLIGLRYLGLRNNKLRRLPRSLGCLKRLEVLDVALNFIEEFPNVIWRIDSLRHLYMSDITCKGPVKLDMKNLRTLLYIPVAYWKPEQMISLQKLGIKLDENSDVSNLFKSLAKMKNLVYLNLRGTYNRSIALLDGLHNLRSLTKLKLHGWLASLPEANVFPPNLSCLSLVQTYLDSDPMPILEKLENLRYLKLHQAYIGSKMVISIDGFPKLKVLSLRRLLELEDLEIGKGALPELQQLEINFCPQLESLPKEVTFMSQLQELKMVTAAEIASKLRGVDSYKISSIQSVILTGY